MSKVDHVKTLLEKDDFIWYKEMISKSTFGNKMDDDKKNEIIEKAVKQANNFKERLISDKGLKEPMGYIIAFDIPLEYQKEEPTYGYQYLGYYRTKTKSITLNYTTLKAINNKYKESELDGVQIEKVKDTVLMHELFHYLEDFYPSGYSKEKHLDTKTFGIFKSKINLAVVGEIAAVHFSKIMTNLDHSPLIYEYIYKI